MRPTTLHLFSPAPRTRWVRASAWAAAVFAVLQVFVLPLPAVPGPLGWEFHPWSLVLVAVSAALAWGAFRRVRGVLAALAGLGLWRLGVFAMALGRVLAGPAGGAERAVTVVGAVVTIPFAVCWVGGALSALRGRPRDPA